MGEMQIEILKKLISERFGVEISVDDGRILYRETILAPVEGVGHFEPLPHYAEVHLLLEPLPRGAGSFSPPHVRLIHSIRIFKGLCWRISAKKFISVC